MQIFLLYFLQSYSPTFILFNSFLFISLINLNCPSEIYFEMWRRNKGFQKFFQHPNILPCLIFLILYSWQTYLPRMTFSSAYRLKALLQKFSQQNLFICSLNLTHLKREKFCKFSVNNLMEILETVWK